jgi:carboxypeptidase Q
MPLWPCSNTASAIVTATVLCFAGSVAAYDFATVTPAMRAKAQSIIGAALSPANRTDVYDRLAVLTDDFGPRFSGTMALERALDWVVATARTESAWYNTTTEPVMVPAWVRGDEWATLRIPTRNKTLHMVGLGMSNGTHGRVVDAPVVVVKSKDDFDDLADDAVRGKVVVWNVPFTTYGETVQYREYGGVWAADRGAAASVIRSVASYSMQSPHTGGSVTTTIPCAAVSVEDATQMQRLFDRGVPMTLQLFMDAHQDADRPSRNIIFELRGSEKPDEYVVFGGHSDSWDIAEGAMDDGGGITSAWGAIRLLASLGIRAKRTLRAVMWVNEENGDRGGQAYAKRHAGELNRTSLAMETDEGAFAPWALSFTGSDVAYNQLLLLKELLAPLGSGNVTRGGGGTDIDPMRQHGVPVASITPRDPRATNQSNNPCLGMLSPADFADKALGSQRGIPDGYFWFHHAADDTIDRMDPLQLQQVAATLAVWAVTIGDLPELLPRGGEVPPLPTTTTAPTGEPTPTGGPMAGPPQAENDGPNGLLVGLTIVFGIIAVGAVGAVVFIVTRQRRGSVYTRQESPDEAQMDHLSRPAAPATS